MHALSQESMLAEQGITTLLSLRTEHEPDVPSDVGRIYNNQNKWYTEGMVEEVLPAL